MNQNQKVPRSFSNTWLLMKPQIICWKQGYLAATVSTPCLQRRWTGLETRATLSWCFSSRDLWFYARWSWANPCQSSNNKLDMNPTTQLLWLAWDETEKTFNQAAWSPRRSCTGWPSSARSQWSVSLLRHVGSEASLLFVHQDQRDSQERTLSNLTLKCRMNEPEGRLMDLALREDPFCSQKVPKCKSEDLLCCVWGLEKPNYDVKVVWPKWKWRRMRPEELPRPSPR